MLRTCYELLGTLGALPGCRQRDRKRSPTWALSAWLLCCAWLALRPEGAAAGAGRGWLWRAERRLCAACLV